MLLVQAGVSLIATMIVFQKEKRSRNGLEVALFS